MRNNPDHGAMEDRDENYANVVMMLEVAFICFLSFYTV